MEKASGDMFRDRLAQAASEIGRPELAYQSLGRPLTDEEQALAQAMMEIYGSGVSDLSQLADDLSARKITVPGENHANWSLDALHSVLSRINSDLDAAYEENGYGA